MKVEIKDFGTYNEVKYDEIVVSNDSEFSISFSNLGARINSWRIPDKDGQLKSIVLGYENAQHVFETAGLYYGATIGRVAGRIKAGSFDLKGESFQLPLNEEKNHLHGGDNSFDVQKWAYEIEEFEDRVDLHFSYVDKAGTNNYPGNLEVQVTHSISKENKWTVSYRAKTDKSTLFNPTNHVYFNLNGDNQESIENHTVQLNADYYLPVDEENLPTGEVRSVEGSPFDLRKGPRFGDLLTSEDAQFNLQKGFDHPFLLNPNGSHQVEVSVPNSPYHLYMKTEEPCVVIYTHNSATQDTKIWGNELKTYAGLTLETQKEPDAVNHEEFHSIVLEPDEIYESKTEYWLKASN